MNPFAELDRSIKAQRDSIRASLSAAFASTVGEDGIPIVVHEAERLRYGISGPYASAIRPRELRSLLGDVPAPSLAL